MKKKKTVSELLVETNTKVKISKQRIKVATNERKAAIELSVANTHLLRSQLLQKLLNPGKDINLECGYPDDITIADYKAMYKRSGVAKRVVRILPEETWALTPTVYEIEETEETEFEKKWKTLQEERKIFHYLQRVDVLSGIGQFGILLLGISDGKELNEPVEGINEITGEKVGKSEYELIYLKPFDQSSVEIKEKEPAVNSPRYGFPKMYNISFEGVSKIIHWTRVLHVADDREMSEVLGSPRMEPVYNRLLDVRKILGGSGEMFWKGGFPGLSFETQPDVEGLDVDSIKDQMELYMAGMQRYLATEGITVKSLKPQVSSPKEHIETNMRNIAISLGIPYRIFLGTEEAKLASAQDTRTWNKRLSQRQENYVSPYIVRPFIDRLMAFGVLPEVENYVVDWPDLNAPTDEDKANVAKILTEALSKYVGGGVDSLIPPMEYLTKILGMTQEEAEAIEKAAMDFIGMEEEPEEEEPIVEGGEETKRVKKVKKKVKR